MARNFVTANSDTIISNRTFVPPAQFTLSGWIYVISGGGGFQGVYFWESGDTLSSAGLYLHSNNTAYTCNTSGGNESSFGATTFSNNIWYHFAMVRTLTTGVAGYVNGAVDLAPTGNNGTAVIEASKWYLGSLTLGSANFLNGRLEHVAAWNAVLTPPEILSLARGTRPGNIRPANLIAYMPFDDSAAPAQDLSVYKNNGVLTGTSFAVGATLMPRPTRIISPSFTTAAGGGAKFRRSLSSIGTRTGSRQLQGWGAT